MDEKLTQENGLKNIIIAIAIVMGFIFIVSVFIFYVKENYGISCSCRSFLPWMIASIASLGVFVGILSYYFLSRSFQKQKRKIYTNLDKTLNFLDSEERVIISEMIKKKGECVQNTIGKSIGMDAVKLHRRLNTLESKGIIRKEKHGMTNRLVLDDELKELFVK